MENKYVTCIFRKSHLKWHLRLNISHMSHLSHIDVLAQGTNMVVRQTAKYKLLIIIIVRLPVFHWSALCVYERQWSKKIMFKNYFATSAQAYAFLMRFLYVNRSFIASCNRCVHFTLICTVVGSPGNHRTRNVKSRARRACNTIAGVRHVFGEGLQFSFQKEIFKKRRILTSGRLHINIHSMARRTLFVVKQESYSEEWLWRDSCLIAHAADFICRPLLKPNFTLFVRKLICCNFVNTAPSFVKLQN